MPDHDARAGGLARKAPQRAHPRRSGLCQRPAVASVSRRAPIARQGSEHSRHRVRAPVAGTERHAACDRRHHPPDRRSRSAEANPRSRDGRGRRSPGEAGRDRRAKDGGRRQAQGFAGALGQGARAGGEDSRAAREAGSRPCRKWHRRTPPQPTSAAAEDRSCRPWKANSPRCKARPA